jgi:antitoxin (DNA-binding transcriptional repressor) of toxin-antitoxin stability system
MASVLTLPGGAKAVMRKVSDLQRNYPAILEEVAKGHSVIMQRSGSDDPVAVIVDPDAYTQALHQAARTEMLEREVAHLQTLLDLALAGGATLDQVRETTAEGQVKPLADIRRKYLGDR